MQRSKTNTTLHVLCTCQKLCHSKACRQALKTLGAASTQDKLLHGSEQGRGGPARARVGMRALADEHVRARELLNSNCLLPRELS
eukprot:1996018-Amphidinium_carterae.1